MYKQLKLKYQQIAPALPAIAFFAGFLWDAVTLGIKIKSSDLYIVLGYLASAFLCQGLMVKDQQTRISRYYPALFQFFLGGIFSAMVVFYFKSSAQLLSYFTVGGICVLLVMNEFLSTHYTKQKVSWLMLTVCCAMFFNFFLPHLFGSISHWFFYLSLILTLAILAGVQKLLLEKTRLTGPVTVVLLLVGLFFLNWIPPVPLVQKKMFICHNVLKQENLYLAVVESLPWLRKIMPGKYKHHQKPGEPVYCFSSVFAPDGISAQVFHHWQFYNETLGEWESRDRIGFKISSGRESGFRGYTFKKNTRPGLWRINLETKGGRIIGRQKFYILKTGAGENLTLEQKPIL